MSRSIHITELREGIINFSLGILGGYDYCSDIDLTPCVPGSQFYFVWQGDKKINNRPLPLLQARNIAENLLLA